jgi:hypothetical protein
MIYSENRLPLFRIVLWLAALSSNGECATSPT